MLPTFRIAPVVVGVNDSPASRAAMLWGAEEARRRGIPLHLVHAVPEVGSAAGPAHGVGADVALSRGSRVLAVAMRQLRLVEPQVVTSGTVEAGRPADVMLRAARGAFMLVVGAHGPGSCVIPGGSIARWTASHARCPVVAAQRTPRPAGPVVAAIDGSARSETVLETALDEASVRRAPLVVTWALRAAARVPERASVSTGAYPGFGDPPDAAGPDGDVAATYEAVASAASETLSELLARWGPKYPMVTTEVQVNAQDPVRMLVRASITSQLLVVGARRVAGRDGLGRVARAVLDGARCPVMVVRSRA